MPAVDGPVMLGSGRHDVGFAKAVAVCGLFGRDCPLICDSGGSDISQRNMVG
jgi:hypothetical protein